MPVGSAIAIFLLIWTLTLFAVLPWRVRTHGEASEGRVAGQADSAPSDPRLLWKLKWTTLIAGVLFALFYANYVQGWVTLADIIPVRPAPR